MTKSMTLVLVAHWVLASLVPVRADGTYVVARPGKVYYGEVAEFANPVVLSSSRVFGKIKEWKEIEDRGLTQRDPEYWILLERANRRFHRAMHRVARKDGLDLVAESGALVRGDEVAVPDVTEAVIAALDNQ